MLEALRPVKPLLDAQKTAREQPGHFCCPTQGQLFELKPTDWVEICLDGEFLWCDIETISDDILMVSEYVKDEVTGQYEGNCESFCIEKKHVFRIIPHNEWLEMVVDG